MLNYSNNFEKVKVKEIKGFSIFYLTKRKALKNSGSALLYLEKTNEKVIKDINNLPEIYSSEKYFAERFNSLSEEFNVDEMFSDRQKYIEESERNFIN